MSESETTTEVKTTEVKTFTQDQVNAFMAEEKRKTQASFADYADFKAKAEKFDKAEQASLSEIERERKARETVEVELKKYQTREQVSKWAVEIVKDSPIPASVLRGSTKEELIEHFEQLKELKELAAPPPKTRTHVPPGKPTDGEPTGSRAAAAIREMRRDS